MAHFSVARTSLTCIAHVVSRTDADRVQAVLLSARGVKALLCVVESRGDGADLIERLLAGTISLSVMATRDASTLADRSEAPGLTYTAPDLPSTLEGSRTNTDTAGPSTVVVTRKRNELTYKDRTVVLRPRELELLLTIAGARGAVVSKSALLELVWKAPSTLKTRTVDTHVGTLRGHLRLLGIDAAIATHRARGYAWACALPVEIR